jgi:hypothetical protein
MFVVYSYARNAPLVPEERKEFSRVEIRDAKNKDTGTWYVYVPGTTSRNGRGKFNSTIWAKSCSPPIFRPIT